MSRVSKAQHILCAAVLATLGMATAAHADVWDTNATAGVTLADGIWSDTQARWVTQTTDGTSRHVWAGGLADFNRKVTGSATVQFVDAATYTVTLGSNVSTSGLRYQNDSDRRVIIAPDAGGLYSITLTGNLQDNNIAVGDSNGSMTINAPIILSTGAGTMLVRDVDNTLTVNGSVSGSGIDLNIGDGTYVGTLKFTASNSYTGVTNVNGGKLWITNANALGSTAAGTVVNTGAKLSLQNTVGITYAPEALTLNGGTLHKEDSLSDSLDQWTGNVTLGSTSTIWIDRDANSGSGALGNELMLSGQVSFGANTLYKRGAGLLAISNAANTSDAGSRLRIQMGSVYLESNQAIGANADVLFWAVNAADYARLQLADTSAAFDRPIISSGYGKNVLWFVNQTGTAEASGTVDLTRTLYVRTEEAGAVGRISGVISGTPGGMIKTGVGTIELTNPGNSYTGETSVAEGTLRFAASQTQGTSVRISNAAVAEIAAGGDKLLVLNGLIFNAGTTGKVDVNDNDMIIHNGDAAALTAAVAAGRGDAYSPTWDQSGIISSVAKDFYDNNYVDLVTIGVVKNQDFEDQVFLPQLETFGGETVTSTDVLVKYTYMGDADLTGEVDGSDYQLIDTGYNFGLTPMWVTGDFNYDGAIDGSDYQLIDTAYGLQLFGPLGATTAAGVVPEPASLGVLAVGAMGLLARRRRM